MTVDFGLCSSYSLHIDKCLICNLYYYFNQDYILGWVPAPNSSANQEAGRAPTEGVLQRRPHHSAPARTWGENCGLVQKPNEEVHLMFIYLDFCLNLICMDLSYWLPIVSHSFYIVNVKFQKHLKWLLRELIPLTLLIMYWCDAFVS